MYAVDNTKTPVLGVSEDNMSNTMQHDDTEYDSDHITYEAREEPGNNNHIQSKV